jgi:hypothetical protein
MPPQQPDGLLDVIDDGLDFGAHTLDRFGMSANADVAGAAPLRNGLAGSMRHPQVLPARREIVLSFPQG